MGCSVGVPQRRDGGVAHVNVDSPCAAIVLGEDAVGGIACRLNRCQRNVDPDVAGRLRRGIWVGRHRGPVAKIGSDALGYFTRRRDMQVLATDFDVPAAYMTAIHALGIVTRRVDVVAYETASFSEAGLDVDEDAPGAFMMAIHAVGVIFRRVDVDVLQDEGNIVAGSVGLCAFDSLAGSGRRAAHGGLLGRRIAGAESEHGEQGHDAHQWLRAHRGGPPRA